MARAWYFYQYSIISMFSSHLWFAFLNKKKNLAGQTVEFRHKFSIKITCLDSLTNIYVWKLHTSIYVQLSNCWLPKLKLPSRSRRKPRTSDKWKDRLNKAGRHQGKKKASFSITGPLWHSFIFKSWTSQDCPKLFSQQMLSPSVCFCFIIIIQIQSIYFLFFCNFEKSVETESSWQSSRTFGFLS